MNDTLLLSAKNGDLDAQTQLLEENEPLVWSIVRRYIGRGTEPEDLFQLGCIGFLKAVRGFDPAFGTQFSTYAVPKIAGEIRRFLRDDGAIKVSRTVKEHATLIRNARQKYITSFGREPTLSELSETLGLTVEDIALAETATATTESLQQACGEDGFTLESVLSVAGAEDDFLERLALREALASLPDKERQVLALRYFHGLTQAKTAEIIGVSQVQVSRIERNAILKLRNIFHDVSVDK